MLLARSLVLFECVCFLLMPATGACMQKDNAKSATLEKILATVNDADLAESLMVRLAYKFGMNMFGRQMNDRISTTPHAKSIQVHPYPWFAAGAAAILSKEDKDLNISVVLIRQKNRPNVWHLPGGYAFAAPLAGGENGIDLLDRQMKDEAEEEILHGNSHAYEHIAKKYNIDYSNPSWKTSRTWDKDLLACVRREVNEEIGVDVTTTPELILQEVKYIPSIKIQVIDNTYLINLKDKDVALKPDNIEIDTAVWVAISDIKQEKDKFSYQGITIPAELIEQLNAAVKQVRAKHFILGSEETLAKLAAILGQKILLPESNSVLSRQAHAAHKKLLQQEQELLDKIGKKAL